MIEYILKGISHYIYLLINMIDFKDNGFIIIIIVGIILMCIKDKTVYKSVISVAKSLYCIFKTKVGFLITMLVLSYYIYILICFENNYNFLLIILTICLFVQDIVKLNLRLLPESKLNIVDVSKEISLPILLLFTNEFVTMVEENNFSNMNLVFYSLIFIPIYIIIIIIFKHFVFFEDTYNIYKKQLKVNDYEFFKIVSIISIKCGDYKLVKVILKTILSNNSQLDYSEMKLELKNNIDIIFKENKDEKKKKIKKQKLKKGKLSKTFEVIWIANIVCIIYAVMNKRFCNVNYDISYYWSMIILNIYLWCDLMKNRDIKNQYDFVMYMFINIIIIVMLIFYFVGLNRNRLSEMLFYIPILLAIHLKVYYKRFSNFMDMPFLTKDNFFGLDPSKYNKNS